MKYITLADLSETIRKNFYKIPHDVDFIIGIPRSGMICASYISCMLNVPLSDINSFCRGLKPTGGGRLRYYKKDKTKDRKKKVLVVDDTVFDGTSKDKARKQLEKHKDKNDFIFLAVYADGPGKNKVDICLEDLTPYTYGYKCPVLYEWNIFHQNEYIMERCVYDIDGVLCVNPPDERNNEAYLSYIENAVPLFTPTTKVGALFTYRLSKNQDITKKWLEQHNIRYNKLYMFKANTWDERHNMGISSEALKGEYYRQTQWAKLFVESDDYQAVEIFKISGKPVYSVEANKLYSNPYIKVDKSMRTLLCCIAKEENKYIREFVEWYKSIGFTNICIYDNNDVDGERFEDVIGDYIKDGFVIIRDCRGKKGFQQTSYQLCYDEFSDNYDWLAFFDVDEFLELDKKYRTVSDFLSDNMFNSADLIRVSWKFFDDNDLVRVIDNDYNVRKRFTRPVSKQIPENGWTKGIIRGHLGKITISHNRDGGHLNNIPEIKNAVNCKGEKVDNRVINNGICWENAWLCHYGFKTVEEYVNKRKKGWTVEGYDKSFTDNLFSLEKFYTMNEETEEKTKLFNELIKKQ